MQSRVKIYPDRSEKPNKLQHGLTQVTLRKVVAETRPLKSLPNWIQFGISGCTQWKTYLALIKIQICQVSSVTYLAYHITHWTCQVQSTTWQVAQVVLCVAPRALGINHDQLPFTSVTWRFDHVLTMRPSKIPWEIPSANGWTWPVPSNIIKAWKSHEVT